MRERPLFDILDPRPVHTDWNIMFGFASDGASMAADAPPIVNNEAEIRQGFLPIHCNHDLQSKARVANPFRANSLQFNHQTFF